MKQETIKSNLTNQSKKMKRNPILSICAVCVMLLMSVSAVAQSGRHVPVRPVSLDQHDQWNAMKEKTEEKGYVKAYVPEKADFYGED